MSDTLIVLVVVVGIIALACLISWLGRVEERARDRMDQIEKEMYYEQAERDGVEYPPQWRGR
jgi:type II secretory pathway pseudopilin PulG